MLDTGATVSVIKESLAKKLKLEWEMKSDLVNIECANTGSLKYVGITQAVVSLGNSPPLPVMLFVSPDASSTKSAPILLGTNVLAELLVSSTTGHGGCMSQGKRGSFEKA